MASYRERIIKMENMFKCSVCQEMPPCQMNQCRSGHLTCHDCLNKIQRPILCPVCRDPMPANPIRNLAAEQVGITKFDMQFHAIVKAVSFRPFETLEILVSSLLMDASSSAPEIL